MGVAGAAGLLYRSVRVPPMLEQPLPGRPANGLDTISAYDRGAQVYEAWGEDDPVWRSRYRKQFIGALKGKTILEVGCGPGRDASIFEQHGLEVVGLDGSARMLELARQRCPRSRFVQGDFYDLAAAGEVFDGIWSMFSLIHVPRTRLVACLEHWQGHLARRAPLFLGMARSTLLQERLVENWLGVEGNHLQFFYHGVAELETALRTAGLQICGVHDDTPRRYRTPKYQALGLESYLVWARRP